jgi:citrate synthase
VRKTLNGFPQDLPAAPDYNPIRKAIGKTADTEIEAALQSFASMPPSTAVFANPVRHQRTVNCDGEPLELSIRSFGIRGCLLEEDIVNGSADAIRVMFVGLFGRFATQQERGAFVRVLARIFERALETGLPALAKFMKAFPEAPADVSMQYMSALRKARGEIHTLNATRAPGEVLQDLITAHLNNTIAGACSSYMRFLLQQKSGTNAASLAGQTEKFLDSVPAVDPFDAVFSLLLRRPVNAIEARILQTLGAIQIHHGSAGSNMVARYLASLHTRSISDLFTAAQMTLDCARHFGAITDLTDFVAQLEPASPKRRDELIRERAMKGNLPAFGHPEIAAAGRTNRIELDPRPAIYLSPLFDAIDRGDLQIRGERIKRVEIVQRIYQLAFVEGIEKPGRSGKLRIAPNTDFGAWIVQEALGVDQPDRTLLSYVFRGFGWMMDAREQLQQPIIRPVIPPEPGIVPLATSDGVIPAIVDAVHSRLSRLNAFRSSSGV